MPVAEQDVAYRVDIHDAAGLRIATYDEVPLLDAIRSAPGGRDRVEGLLPEGVADLAVGYRVKVYLEDTLFCTALVTRVEPSWGDTRRLILDRYVTFREAIAFEAETEPLEGNGRVLAGYANRRVDQIVRDAINRTLGPVHYTVAHTAYPDGAQREYQKFVARQSVDGPLEVGGTTVGSWVDFARIDLTDVYAKDGDTIAGLKVDGVSWPDLRLMLIDCEETALNSHAKSLHPETESWTTEQYDASGYRLRADAATAALQTLIDTHGIDFIELNPHKDANGDYDDRVDFFGRYLGFVYGGGECFNAAQVENGHAEVHLFADGKFHVPEMALKEYYSYTGPSQDSIEDATTTLTSFDVDNNLYAIIESLAYAAGGHVWSLGSDLAVGFRSAHRADRTVVFDPVEHAVTFGVRKDSVANILFLDGNPLAGAFEKTYARSASIDAFGAQFRSLDLFSIHLEEDAERIAEGLLDDIAYPEPSGSLTFLNGDARVGVGTIVELRGGALRRLDPAIAKEWGDRFAGRLLGRAREVRHRFQGRQVTTTVRFTSPLRTTDDPIRFMTRGQPSAQSLFQFRLDDATVGLDSGYHLD